MSRELQFAFLGCHNCYLASVTWASQSGCPYEPPIIACHGLPDTFIETYRTFANKRYVYNVRGHDCFSFLGEWSKEKTKGHTSTSSHMLAEINTLSALAMENTIKDTRYKKEDLLLSLGPGPGAFFADAFHLKRYRWSNLPSDLEDEIQKEICAKGYGSIYDVEVNAAGGWVIQLDKGNKYVWGGELPEELERALSGGKKRKAKLKRLYLNHQNKHDYVLVFTDGTTHISLHQEFEQPLRNLIERTFSKPEKVKWHFTPSCCCSENSQRQTNAAYYNQRGRFHFGRSNFQQAWTYMREANSLDCTNIDYFNDYCMALVALRGLDPTPEEYIMRFDANNAPRNEYAFIMRDRMGSVEVLKNRMLEVRRQESQQPRVSGWAHLDVGHSVVEVPSNEVREKVYELENHQAPEVIVSEVPSSREPMKRSVLRFLG